MPVQPLLPNMNSCLAVFQGLQKVTLLKMPEWATKRTVPRVKSRSTLPSRVKYAVVKGCLYQTTPRLVLK